MYPSVTTEFARTMLGRQNGYCVYYTTEKADCAMSLLAETLVEEWLNRQGYFTIHGLKEVSGKWIC